MALMLLLALLDACLPALTAPDASEIACHVMSRRICALQLPIDAWAQETAGGRTASTAGGQQLRAARGAAVTC
jgi:hypothetical protein